ncbi:MAG: 6-carboxytetrahydropterin synthase [Phycisphaerales bacterium]
MLTLTRTVRFAVNPPRLGPAATREGPNGYAGSPPVRGLGRHYEIDVVCGGGVDPVTGYLVNIKDIDRAVHATAVPLIARACAERPDADPADLLPEIREGLASTALGARIRSVRWRLSPYYSVEMASQEPGTVLLRQRFDFSASHRLHSPALSEEENRRLYGKCNNPSGHGHNYQFEPCVAMPGAGGERRFALDDLERLAEETIIRRFDHKNLCADTREFAAAGGLNPSVENIARVFYDLLAPAVREAGAGAQLRSITVWETDRTSATYPG